MKLMNKDTYVEEPLFEGMELRIKGERLLTLVKGEVLTPERIAEIGEKYDRYLMAYLESYKKELRKLIEGMKRDNPSHLLPYAVVCEIKAYNLALSSLLDNELLKIKE